MIDKSIVRAALLASLLLVGGLAHAGASQGDAEAAIAAAEAARAESARMKYEWNTIAPLIEQAKAAVVTGAFDDAVALAGKAKYQSEAAIAQAKHESEAWQGAVLR